jgi:hypothetical protein
VAWYTLRGSIGSHRLRGQNYLHVTFEQDIEVLDKIHPCTKLLGDIRNPTTRKLEDARGQPFEGSVTDVPTLSKSKFLAQLSPT